MLPDIAPTVTDVTNLLNVDGLRTDIYVNSLLDMLCGDWKQSNVMFAEEASTHRNTAV